MTKNGKTSASDLRKKAEELLKSRNTTESARLSEIEILKLFHELEVHQVELELQNEELLQAKEEAEKASEKYIELYDFAPSGYFTISRKCEIIDLNFAGARMLGKERSHLKKSNFCMFISDNTKEDFINFFEKIIQGNIGESCDITINPYGDNAGYIHLTGIAARDSDQCLITAVDITDRRLFEEKIKNLLAEKEILLKEVHHRVKNNMFTIKNLLSLQLISLEEPSAIDALTDARNRIDCMMMIYDKLFHSNNFRNIPVQNYLPLLINQIISSFPDRKKITTYLQIDDFELGISMVINIGIITNELLTNSMKYAFKGKNTGSITVVLSMENNQILYSIEDDGIGIPDSVDLYDSTGFGLNLVRMITEQMNGTINLDRSKGSRFILKFDL